MGLQHRLGDRQRLKQHHLIITAMDKQHGRLGHNGFNALWREQCAGKARSTAPVQASRDAAPSSHLAETDQRPATGQHRDRRKLRPRFSRAGRASSGPSSSAAPLRSNHSRPIGLAEQGDGPSGARNMVPAVFPKASGPYPSGQHHLRPSHNEITALSGAAFSASRTSRQSGDLLAGDGSHGKFLSGVTFIYVYCARRRLIQPSSGNHYRD